MDKNKFDQITADLLGVSMQELQKNPEYSLSRPLRTTGADPNTYVEGLKKLDLATPVSQPVGNLYTPESPNEMSKYDSEIQTLDQLQNLNDFRADKQSNLLKATNAVISGTLSGLATAVEDLSYILDFEEWGKIFSTTDTFERNWLGQTMTDLKEGLYETMPIYERDSDDSFSDSFFRWSTLRSGIDSMVGFAIPGGVVSKALGAGTKALRASRVAAYLNKLAETNKLAKGAEKGLNFLTTGPTGEVVNSLVSGAITNDAEGKMMAFELADNARMNYVSDRAAQILKTDSSITPEQAMQMAKKEMDKDTSFNNSLAEQQNYFINRNRVFMLTDAFGLHGVFKGIGKTRNLLKDKTVKQAFRDLGTLSSDNWLLQMGKEGAEEIGQNILQSEAEYQVRKDRGALNAEELELSLTDRILEFGTSTQALVEGAMGFLTGGLQRNVMRFAGDAISGDPLGKKRKAEYAKLQEAQQAILDQYVDDNLKKLITVEGLKTASAVSKNTDANANAISNTYYNELMGEAFANGTTEQLERAIQDIASLSPEQAAEKGYEGNYKEQAEQRLKELAEAEKMYLNYSSYANSQGIIANRLKNRTLIQYVEDLQKELKTQQEELTQKIAVAYPQAEEFIGTTPENIQDLEEYKTVETTKKAINLVSEGIRENDKIFKEMISPQQQAEYRQAEKDIAREIERDLKSRVKEAKKKKSEEVSANIAIANTPEEKQTIISQAKEAAKGDEIATQAVEEVEQENNYVDSISADKNIDEDAPLDSNIVNKILSEVTNIDPENKTPSNEKNRKFFTGLRMEVLLENVKNEDDPEDVGYWSVGAIKKLIDEYESIPKKNPLEERKLGTLKKLLERINGLVKQQNKPIETNKVTVASKSDNNIYSEEGIVIETSESSNDINEVINNIQDDLDLKSTHAADLVAYLSRQWKKVTTPSGYRVKASASNSFRDTDTNRLILDPTKLHKGDLLYFKIADDPTIEVYYNGNISTWGQVKNRIEDSELSRDEKDKKINALVPIIIETTKDLIGYVHDINWINRDNLGFETAVAREVQRRTRQIIEEGLPKGVTLFEITKRITDELIEAKLEEERQKLMNLRNAIVKGELTKTKITNISNGHLIRCINNKYISTLEALPDNKVKLAIYKNGNFTTKVDKLLGKPENLKEGYTYALLPARDGSTMAVPLKRNLLTSKQVSSISQAIRIFIKAKKGEKLNTGEQQVVDKIKEIIKLKNSAGNNVNFDIRTTDGIKNYVSIFTYVHKADKMNLVNTIVSNPSDYSAISIEENANSLVLSLARGAGINIATAKLDHQTGNFLNEKKFLDNLEDHLQSCYFYGSSLLINKDKVDIPIIGENNLVVIESSPYTTYVKRHTSSNVLSWNLGTEENPNYVYFAQPSISFDIQTAKARAQAARSNVPVKKEIIENTPASKQEGDIDFDAVEAILDDDDAVYNNLAFTDEDLYKAFGKTQEGITLITSNTKLVKVPLQRQVIDMYAEKIARTLINSEASTLSAATIKNILAEGKAWFERQVALAKQRPGEKGEQLYLHLKEYVDNWSNLEKLVKITLASRSGFKVSDIQNEAINELAEYGEDNSNHERNNFTDTYSLELDSKDTVSAKMKLFLSFIPNGKVNYLTRESQFEPFDTVYNSLSAMLAGSKPNLAAMMDRLNEINQDGTLFPWLTNLLAKLENASGQIKREFVTAMNKHYVSMKFTMWRKLGNYRYAMEVWDANANSIQQVITNSWYNNLINRDLTTLRNDEYVYNPSVVEEIKKERQDWSNSKVAPNIEQLGNWFKKLGIELSPKSLETLKRGEFVYGGKVLKYSQLFQKNGLIDSLISKLAPGEAIDMIGNQLFSDSIVKALIALEARNTAHIFSNSHKSGTKTIYSYTNDKYLIDRFTNLKTDPVLLTALSKLSYNSTSSLLRQLVKTDDLGNFIYNEDGLVEIDTESKFYNNFTYDYLGLDAIEELGVKLRDSKSLNDLSPTEHEVIKLAMFNNNGSISKDGTRIGKVFYPTMSDKTTMIMLSVPLFNVTLNADGTVTNDVVDFIYDSIVQGEINRILKWQTITNNGENPVNVSAYNEGAKLFFTFAQLNNIDELYTTVGDKRILKNINADPNLVNLIKDSLAQLLDTQINQQLDTWNNLGIGLKEDKFEYLDSKYLTYLNKQVTTKDKNFIQRLAAADFAINNIISNVNISQLFTGDPALYYKKEKSTATDDYVQIAQDTFINIGKRLAGDIAPGQEADWTGISESYKLLVLNDAESISLSNEYYKSLGFSDKTYGGITGTDAQELTTLGEHLNVMYAFGKLSDEQYKSLLNKFKKGEEYTTEELNVILQPIKPVYVHNRVIAESDVDARTYVKSSSFPLIPQFTKGLQIDALRVAMEENGIDRAAYMSAVKVGAPLNKATIWDKEGNIIPGSLDKLNPIILNREGFKIQQEVPYHEDKDRINGGTQERKLLFSNMSNLDGFTYHGKTMKGSELEQEYTNIYKEIWDAKLSDLQRELEFNTDTGTINVKKLVDLLQDEAIKRNYPINDRIGLVLDSDNNFRFPLWALPSSAKYEALLLSIVDNRVRKIKIPGMSYVLGSEEGFKVKTQLKTEEALTENIKNDIVFTSSWTGKLLPQGLNEDGTFRNTQVLVPSKFRDSRGNLIDIRKYAKRDKDGFLKLDESKLPKEYLKLFGFRIPTQGHGSMAGIEIVGFLPENVGDLVIASRDFTVQMGSDFDVDKLYTYQYQLLPINGKFKRVEEISDEEVEDIINKRYAKKRDEAVDNLLSAIFGYDVTGLEEIDINNARDRFNKIREEARRFNNLLDIHMSVMSNPNPKVQAMIASPVSFGKLKGEEGNLAKTIDNYRKERLQKSYSFNGFSADYQRTKYVNATAGKSGVATFSSAAMFLATSQNKELNYVEKEKGKNIFKFAMGKLVTTGSLSNPYTLVGKRLKSKVMEAFQSAAVDNEKEQILDKLNINSHTFACINAMVALGFEEDSIVAIISQDVVFEYVKRLVDASSSLADFDPKLRERLYDDIRANILDRLKITDTEADTLLMSYEDISTEELLKYIKEGETLPSYGIVQLSVLDKFLKLTDIGKKIASTARTVNVESAGLGPSFLATLEKEEDVYRLQNITNAKEGAGIENAGNLVGDFIVDSDNNRVTIVPKTIQGFALVNSLFTANQVFSVRNKPLFPYKSGSFQTINYNLRYALNKADLRGKGSVELSKSFFDGATSFLYTKPDLFGIMNSSAKRKELFIDSKDNISTASYIHALQNTNYGKVNPFIGRLTTSIQKNGQPSLIKYNAAAGVNLDESGIYQGFVEMLLDNKDITVVINGKNHNINTRALAIDLIHYTYLSGGIQRAIEFVKYIPIDLLDRLGFSEKLKDIDFNVAETFNISSYETFGTFEEQWIQHNPGRLPVKLIGDGSVGSAEENNIQVLSTSTLTTGGKDKTVIDTFTVSNPSVDHRLVRSVDFGGEFIFEPYTSAYLGNGKYALYKYDGLNYVRIPTLGVFGMSEYQADIPAYQIAESILSETNTERNIQPAVETAPVAVEVVPSIPKETIKQYQAKYKLTSESSLDVLREVYRNAENPDIQHIAESLGIAAKKLGIDPHFLYSKHLDTTGKYFGNQNRIVIRVKPAKGISMDRHIQENMLHEMTHALVAKLVDTYVDAKTKHPEAMSFITRGQKATLDSLDSLREMIASYTKRHDIQNQEIVKATSDLNEFIAASLTSSGFRQYMSEHIWAKERTFWQRIVDLLTKLCTELGIFKDIDANKIPALMDTIILNLIDSQTTAVKPAPVKTTNRINRVTDTEIKEYKEAFEKTKNQEGKMTTLFSMTNDFNVSAEELAQASERTKQC